MSAKKLIITIDLIIFVMLFLPMIATHLAPADEPEVLSAPLFMIINPIFSIALGVLTGCEIKSCWFLPFLNSAVFYFSALAWYANSPSVWVYAYVYLGFSVISCVVTSMVNSRKSNN